MLNSQPFPIDNGFYDKKRRTKRYAFSGKLYMKQTFFDNKTIFPCASFYDSIISSLRR